MKDCNCIFCKIAAGDIPSKTVEENDMLRVILDVAPATRGHALILPKEHCRNLYDLPEDMAAEVMKTAKRTALRMREKLGCDGVNLVQNNEEAAGQTVFHFHMHVIPRYSTDSQKIGWTPKETTSNELEDILETLK